MTTIRHSLTDADLRAGHCSSSPSDGQAKGHSLAVHCSSETDEWPTPDWLFELLDQEFAFTLDPCSTPTNARCARHFTRSEDGLTQDWAEEIVFMNPPYGREIRHWMGKAFESAQAGATVVCLVPARTDTAWWHGHAKQGAPFPSAIVILRPGNGRDQGQRKPKGEETNHRLKNMPWCIARCLPV